MTFHQFCQITEIEPVPSEKSLLMLFQKMDELLLGYLTHEEFLLNMTTRGEKLPTEMIENLLRNEVYNDDKKFYYQKYCYDIIETSKKLENLAIEKVQQQDEEYQMNSGIFLVNKDKGLSSNKAIQKIKKRLDIKKIGHFGTLDPLAEGLLICGINRGTKLSEKFLNLDKSYFSKIMLGIQTTTDDSEGDIIKEKKIQISEKEIIEMTKTFIGESKQKPPFFSALKHKGKPLYKYAREGKLIDKEPRNIKIYKILNIFVENAFVSFEISCLSSSVLSEVLMCIPCCVFFLFLTRS